MRHEEDEIQILGAPDNRRKRRGYAYWGAVIGLLLVGIALLFWLMPQGESGSPQDAAVSQELKELSQPDDNRMPERYVEPKLDIWTDTINDVPMKFFQLTAAKARLCMGTPSEQDSTLLMVLPAADIRKDNLGIVGDFVLEGKQYGNGKRKEGYVAILDERLFLGVSSSDTVMNYCADHRGSFFRQYALVFDGQVVKNKLKGKSLRRAVARRDKDDSVYVIVSLQRESLYDFSEALADYGMTDAIYLPGGDAYAFYRKDTLLDYLGTSQEHIYPNTNYLLFCR